MEFLKEAKSSWIDLHMKCAYSIGKILFHSVRPDRQDSQLTSGSKRMASVNRPITSGNAESVWKLMS